MKILFIDDDDYKIDSVINYLKEKGYNDIDVEKALNPALKRIRRITDYNLILLDMSIPLFSQSVIDNHLSYGGQDFLKEINRRGLRVKVIVITQYEVFDGEIIKTVGEMYDECIHIYDGCIGVVHYSSLNEKWKNEIEKILEENYG